MLGGRIERGNKEIMRISKRTGQVIFGAVIIIGLISYSMGMALAGDNQKVVASSLKIDYGERLSEMDAGIRNAEEIRLDNIKVSLYPDAQEKCREAIVRAELGKKLEEEAQAKREREAKITALIGDGSAKGVYKRFAYDQFEEFGWTDDDFECLISLWNRESGWNPDAHNSSSGAHGIPQALPASKMSSYGSDYYTNYKPQILWGLNYIAGRYGTPSNAWGHFCSYGWY